MLFGPNFYWQKGHGVFIHEIEVSRKQAGEWIGTEKAVGRPRAVFLYLLLHNPFYKTKAEMMIVLAIVHLTGTERALFLFSLYCIMLGKLIRRVLGAQTQWSGFFHITTCTLTMVLVCGRALSSIKSCSADGMGSCRVRCFLLYAKVAPGPF